MHSYEVAETELRFEGKLSRVRMDKVRMPGGKLADREIVEHPSAVAVVPVDDEGRVMLIRHYRPALRTWLVEVPAGKLDVDGEAPVDAARRELAEEVGLRAGHWTELVRFANSGGWTTECTTVYLATGLDEIDDPTFVPEAEEADLEVLRVPLADAVAMAERGEITDAKTLIGLLLARARLAR
jgi:8-oxo-dGTP pyrophosphatase MutT (NUDIX family)